MRRGGNLVQFAAIVHERVGGDSDVTLWGNDPATPVAETIAIGVNRCDRAGDNVVCNNQIGYAGVMDVQRQNHGCRLWAGVN